jgi:HAMP domain-containing protein
MEQLGMQNVADSSPTATPVKRRLRNFLLDTRFQLKFTGFILTATAVVACLLGAMLWRTTRTVVEESETAVESRLKAAETSKELGNAALSNELMKQFNDPAFERQLKEQSLAIDARYEAEKLAIEAQRGELLRKQRRLVVVLVGGLVALCLIIAGATIVSTHRIVGPLYRIRRLVQDIAAGKLSTNPGQTRPGDEFKDLFEEFTRMLDQLRLRDRQACEQLAVIIARAESSGVPSDLMVGLRSVQASIQSRLE